MKRPPQPTGDLTKVIRVVTHPTEVIRRAEVRMAKRGGPSPRLPMFLARGCLVLTSAGAVVSILAFTVRQVPEVAVPGLVLGVGLVAAGMSMATLEGLIDPERPEVGERLAHVVWMVWGKVRGK